MKRNKSKIFNNYFLKALIKIISNDLPLNLANYKQHFFKKIIIYDLLNQLH